MNLDYNKLQDNILSKGFAFFDDGTYNLNIFGIRSSDVQVDEFNDYIGIAYRDDFNNPCLKLFKATTKPGLYWLKNKLGNIKGTAILSPGQYRGCWSLGYHKSYQALVQKGMGNFQVWRDNDSDGDLDMEGQVFNDVRGLNLHTTSFKNDIDQVGAYSAGCQVIQDDLDFQIFLSIILRSANIYGNTFSYTLLEQNDFI
ncbi:MAG: hypothetical protein KAR19_18575 [Bacteroidales bacterium]|nr:hypothetical protein [Bacteroidales bacterium]